jgi:hypothetical protein
MKTTEIIRRTLTLLVLAGIAFVVAGCNEEPPAGLYDTSWTSGAKPVVSNVSIPTQDGLANVTVHTITGTGFSPVLADNIVFFDATPGIMISATTTQLMVKAPNLVKDTILLKVAVQGASLFSDPVKRRLIAPVTDYGQWKTADETYGIAVDASGAVYGSVLSGGVGAGVKKFNGDGTRSDYSPVLSSTVPRWNSMKFGPGGYLFVCARNIVWRIPPGGGTAAVWQSVTGSAAASDIDFDANNNLWVAGIGNSNIYRVRSADKNVKPFACRGDMRAVRVYNGYVYVGGKRDSLEKVFRFPIVTADSLGAEEEYFNLTGVYGVNKGGIYALTFSADGVLYIGTDHADGIRLVNPDRSSQTMYPGVLFPKNISFAWGTGFFLFTSRTGGVNADGSAVTNALLQINTQKDGAPTYGR